MSSPDNPPTRQPINGSARSNLAAAAQTSYGQADQPSFEQRLKAERQKAGLDHPQQEGPSPRQRSGLGLGLRVLSELILAPLICGFIGLWCDRYFGTTPILFIMMIMVGFGIAFYMIYKITQSLDHESS